MDSIDRNIISELRKNCRVSYESLARKNDISSNAIKRRVGKLVEYGIITDFIIIPSLAMLNAELLFALLNKNQSVNDDEFVNMVTASPYVVGIRYDSFGVCLVWAEYCNTKELSELGTFFRSLKGVESVEMHTLPIDRGNKIKLTKLRLRVLEPLLEDPHMPFSEVAKRTGLSARRVRRIIRGLIQSRGILFTIITDIPAGDVLHIVFRVRYNPQSIDSHSIIEMLQSDFENEYYRVIKSAMEPVIWLEFLIEQLAASELIAARIREIPSAELISTIIPYPLKWHRSRRREWLREKIDATLYPS
ncbi:MAG: winged helix-turn-helix transcriptional regulator [Candidatus Thorarchaeota archaeon]|jgi:DNA-binding Lrp family transcriptional regulator